jgi:hypothetical protein
MAAIANGTRAPDRPPIECRQVFRVKQYSAESPTGGLSFGPAGGQRDFPSVACDVDDMEQVTALVASPTEVQYATAHRVGTEPRHPTKV